MDAYKANEQDQRKAETIRRQYVPRQDNKIELLQELDNEVKIPGRVAAGVIGTTGALVLGAGMSQVTVKGNMKLGLILGIPGLAATLLAYPVYAKITGKRKKKYAEEIMNLSGEILAEE